MDFLVVAELFCSSIFIGNTNTKLKVSKRSWWNEIGTEPSLPLLFTIWLYQCFRPGGLLGQSGGGAGGVQGSVGGAQGGRGSGPAIGRGSGPPGCLWWIMWCESSQCLGPPAVLGPAGGRGGAPGPPLPRPVLPRERCFFLENRQSSFVQYYSSAISQGVLGQICGISSGRWSC